MCTVFNVSHDTTLGKHFYNLNGERYVTSKISSKREESHEVLQLNAHFTVTGAQKLGRGTPDTFLKKLNGDRKKTGESLEAFLSDSNVKNVHEKQDTVFFSG